MSHSFLHTMALHYSFFLIGHTRHDRARDDLLLFLSLVAWEDSKQGLLFGNDKYDVPAAQLPNSSL